MELGTHRLILDAVDARTKGEKDRDYLGGSVLGNECDRQIWYYCNRPRKKVAPRIQMIFDVGHILEDYVVKLLRDSGITVWGIGDDGEQFGFEIDVPESVCSVKKIGGHIDGVVQGLPESTVPHLLEVKTANAKRFKQMQEKGVKASDPVYYGQMQIYMKEFKLSRYLYVAKNKDTCDLYVERGKFEEGYGDNLILRGREILASVEPPDRRYKSSTFHKCKFCDHREECWEL